MSQQILTFSAKDLVNTKLRNCTLTLPPDQLEDIPITASSWSAPDQVNIVWEKRARTKPYCHFEFYSDHQTWNRPYSFQLYKEYMSFETEKLAPKKFYYLSSRRNSRDDSIEVFLDKNIPLREQVWLITSVLRQAHKNILHKLSDVFSEQSLKEFDFPAEIRTTCEQYLSYFVDFLREVGVSAVANIQHDEAGRTLFNIKPNNSKIALDTIREALEIYLELPTSPFADDFYETDTRMLRLSSEIDRLKSKLKDSKLREIEQAERLKLQNKLIQAQADLIQEKDRKRPLALESHSYDVSVIQNSAVDTDIIDGEIIESKPISGKELDFGLVKVADTPIAPGVKVPTPYLVRLGIKKSKEIFEYLDKRFNEEDNR